MDAVSLLSKHIDVEQLLNHYDFDGIQNDGEFIRCCCKIHGGNNPTAFVINIETGLWFCHTGGCGGGDAYTLVEKMEGIDFPSAVRFIASFFNVDIANLHIIERKAEYLNELKKFMKTMRGRKKKVDVKTFTIDEEIKPVKKYRKFREDTLQHFQLGFVDSVKLKKKNNDEYVLNNRLVFPIIFDGVQVGLSFRRIKNKDYPKWSHQPAQLETREYLYNFDNAKSKPVIVICEGISDVWAWWEIGIEAVATFGAHITDEQYKLLLRTGADLVLSYDGDDAGREATKKALQMFKYKANLSVVHFDEGEDPESIDRGELLKKYEQRKKV